MITGSRETDGLTQAVLLAGGDPLDSILLPLQPVFEGQEVFRVLYPEGEIVQAGRGVLDEDKLVMLQLVPGL